MRLREFLIGTTLMFLLLTTTKAGPALIPGDKVRPDFEADIESFLRAKATVPLPPAPSPLISADRILGAAYYDTLSVLNASSSCSDFFGGPGAAVEAFNRLIGKVRKEYLPALIGVRMSGSTTNLLNARTRKETRLFDNVTINTNGPFYRKRISHTEATRPRVGSFEPNTKEVRVLILLHELGHVVKGPEGHWLLPDDGNNEELSRQNSFKIEDVCGGQIKGLGKTQSVVAAPIAAPQQ